MKLIFVILISLFLAITAFSQHLEGIINYSISYDVIDKDRPDLEIYKSMIPAEMKLYLKGPSSMLQFIGGTTEGLLGDILYRTSDKTIYSIFHSTKTFSRTPVSSLNKNSDKSLKARKTDSTKIIQGYTCVKYTIKDEKEDTETILWCAKTLTSTSTRIMSYFLESMTEINVAGIEGLPMQIEFKGKEFNLTLEAMNKEQKMIPTNLLMVPKNYKISKADPQLH